MTLAEIDADYSNALLAAVLVLEVILLLEVDVIIAS